MKAWRFHNFNDMRLDDVPEPVCGPNQVIVEPLCVQPSVTEAQLAKGIPTLAFDRIKRRLETDAPPSAFRPRILRPYPGSRSRCHGLSHRRPSGGSSQIALRRLFALPKRTQRLVPGGTGHRLRSTGMLLGTGPASSHRPGEGG